MRALLLMALASALGCSPSHPATQVDRLGCNGCHSDQYDTAPVHAERGYDRACQACHGTSAWKPAEPTHDRFGIATGPHAGYDCSACHLALETDSADITCIGCHAHTRSRVDPYHLGNGDYEWAPRACYRCHPNSGGR